MSLLSIRMLKLIFLTHLVTLILEEKLERVLKMADGVLLLVDAFEGPMPQTRFVLSKAIELGLKPIVVVNKVDKENCTPDEVQDAVFDLMFNPDATEDQLDFETIFGSSKHGWMSKDWKNQTMILLLFRYRNL